MPRFPKQIEIVAGPNGSGKTTFAESYLLRTRSKLVFLNPDLIASGIGPLDFEKASFQAGRVLISEVKNRMELGDSFAFESTLSGRTWATVLSRAKASGYAVTIYFLYLNSIRKNIERIKRRVKQGGHHIPKEAVIRRQPRCFENFWNLYRPLCDNWYVFDNTKSRPELLMSIAQFQELSISERSKFATSFLSGKPGV